MSYSEESTEEYAFIMAMADILLDLFFGGDTTFQDDALAMAYTLAMAESMDMAGEADVLDDTGDE